MACEAENTKYIRKRENFSVYADYHAEMTGCILEEKAQYLVFAY